MAGMTLKVEYLGKLESKFQTVWDDESGDQAGAFGEITFKQKKTSRYCPFSQA